MLGFTIKPSRNAKAKSGEAKFEAETKMEFFVKTEAESNYQKQDMMKFISKKKTGEKPEKAGMCVFGEHVLYNNDSTSSTATRSSCSRGWPTS